jgi:hypothetical protein
VSKFTVTSAESAALMQRANACPNIHDLTGTLTSDPAGSVASHLSYNVPGPVCSLTKPLPHKGSCIRWRIRRLTHITSMWIASPSQGFTQYANSFQGAVEAMNAEVARRKRSANLGR